MIIPITAAVADESCLDSATSLSDGWSHLLEHFSLEVSMRHAKPCVNRPTLAAAE
jgi:hypothetical protein